MAVWDAPRARAAADEGLPPEELIRAFRLMHLSRRLDDREIVLKRQNRIYFQISGAGHEAVSDSRRAWRSRRPRLDLSLLPRPRLCLALGVTAQRCCWRRGRGRRIPPPAGGRCRPTGVTATTTSSSSSSPTGTQFLQAVGCAEAARLPRPEFGRHHAGLLRRRRHQRRRILGIDQRGLSERVCPCSFLIEDNGYAISVPIECQTAGGDVSKLVCRLSRTVPSGSGWHRFPGLPTGRMHAAAAYCREGHGPALVHAHVTRPLFAFAVRRRAPVQNGGRARGRSGSATRC